MSENFNKKPINKAMQLFFNKLIPLKAILIGLVALIIGSLCIYVLVDYFKWSIEISHISSTSVEQRYSNAIRDNNIYFLGVSGEGIFFPGVENRNEIKKYKNIIIDYTGDVLLSSQQDRFKKFAAKYAKEFNLKMLEHINSTKENEKAHTY